MQGREIIFEDGSIVASEEEWLNRWKEENKAEVKMIKRELKEKDIPITEDNINRVILDPHIHKGMKDYSGTGNADTANIIQIDYFGNWEFYMQEMSKSIDRKELRRLLARILKKMTRKEAKLISMRFGLGKYEETKLRRLAEEFQMTINDVYYFLSKTLKKMKKIAKNDHFV